MNSDCFSSAIITDFEFEITGGKFNLRRGDMPMPLCMVAHVLDEKLRHVKTIRMWREELFSSRHPPFDIGDDVLFAAYSAQAELMCFLQLGWPFPKHVFDLHTAYLATSNILLPWDPDNKRNKQRKRLSDACRAYGIAGWEQMDKKAMQEAISEGRWQEYGQEAVFDYCEEDVVKTTELLRAQLRGNTRYQPVNTDFVLYWSNYSAKTVARIQAKGMPTDLYLWGLVQEHKQAVIWALLQQFDPSHGDDEPIYSPEGEWSYARFERWLIRNNIPYWPRLDSGALNLKSDAFRLMYPVHPGIERIHALRDSISFIAKATLPIGRDGRNRPSLFPFGTATGRNAHARSLYNVHAGMRSFMVFPPDTIGAYLDWRTQEIGVAAVRSEDEALKRAYLGGDVYHSLARMCGLTTDPDIARWKKNNVAVRNRMKSLQLAISYGMGVPSLARGLNRHPLVASTIIERHTQTYPRFWEWRADMVQHAMLDRRIESSHGWPLHISTSPNKRTLYNFPMQAGGAEMLRLAAWRLCEAEIIPCMLVHDAVLLEETNPEQIEHAKEIMQQAGRDICEGFDIGVDVDQYLIGGARYYDKRQVAQDMWKTIMNTLQAIGALPARREVS